MVKPQVEAVMEPVVKVAGKVAHDVVSVGIGVGIGVVNISISNILCRHSCRIQITNILGLEFDGPGNMEIFEITFADAITEVCVRVYVCEVSE